MKRQKSILEYIQEARSQKNESQIFIVEFNYNDGYAQGFGRGQCQVKANSEKEAIEKAENYYAKKGRVGLFDFRVNKHGTKYSNDVVIESAQKNEADSNAERTLLTKISTIKELARRLTKDNLVPQLTSFKKYVDDTCNFALKHFEESAQSNVPDKLKYFVYTKDKLKTKEDFEKALKEMKKAYYEEPSGFEKNLIDQEMAIVKTWQKQKFESAQVNESRNYVVTAKVSAPDNINNRDIEDKVEELLDRAGLTVLDIDAARK